MNHLFKWIFTLLPCALLNIETNAQSTTAAAGGEAKSNLLSLNWTLGEVITETSSSQAITLTQGYQQSKLEVISLNQENSTNVYCNVYPNPSSDFVVIDFKGRLDKDSKFSIFDSNGVEVLQNKIEEERSFVSIKNLSAGSYIIKITSPNLSGNNFRIIKTN